MHRSVRRILCVLPLAVSVLAASQALYSGGAGASGGSGSASAGKVAQAKLVVKHELNPISINYKPGQLKGNPSGKTVIMVTNQTGGRAGVGTNRTTGGKDPGYQPHRDVHW